MSSVRAYSNAGAKATGDRMELYAYDTVDATWPTIQSV